MRATFRAAVEAGDLTFACYGAYQIVPGHLQRNDPLDAVWRASEMALDFAREAKYGYVTDIIQDQRVASLILSTRNQSTLMNA
jgi:hypothetical protein